MIKNGKVLINLGISVIFLLAAGQLKAHDAVKLIDSNNKETIFMLHDLPKARIDESKLIIETDRERLICNIETGARIEFIDTNAGINGILPDSFVFSLGGNGLDCQNLKPGSKVYLCDLAGKIITSKEVDSTGAVTIDTTTLPAGVYIFNTNEKSFKFYKK